MSEPGPVARHVRDALEPHRAALADPVLVELIETLAVVTDSCARCGAAIQLDPRGVWVHRNGLRGCRAASYTDEDGWDESFHPRWKASPA